MPSKEEWLGRNIRRLAQQFCEIADKIDPPPITWPDMAPVMRMLEDPEEASYGPSGVEIFFQRNNTRYVINLLSKRECSNFSDRTTESVSAYTIDSNRKKNIWTEKDTWEALSIFKPWSEGNLPKNSEEIVSGHLVGLTAEGSWILCRELYETDEEHKQVLERCQSKHEQTLQAASIIICSALNPNTTTHLALCKPPETDLGRQIAWEDLVNPHEPTKN
ncbi:MAG: hypothetical protein R3D66_01030 [Alphaproteobacteria bacterium]